LNEGRNKDIKIEPDQSFHWTAPHDDDLEYFELSDALLHHTSLQSPPQLETEPTVPAAPKSQHKLFLVSQAVSAPQNDELCKLTGRPARTTSLALIENAADMAPVQPKWVAQNRQMLEQFGYNIELIDLRKFVHAPVDLLQKLQHKQIVWLGGGNTYYLRWMLLASRADEMIVHLVSRGLLVYGGGSAGAIVAGPTLKYFELADNPEGVPTIIQDGLHLTEKVIVPHIDNRALAAISEDINQKLLREKYKTVPLKDAQVYIINGDEERLI
jgi:dipeptidase E